MERVNTVCHVVRQGDWLPKIDFKDARFLRQCCVRLVIYLNDILIIVQSKESAEEAVNQVSHLFVSLGFLIHEEVNNVATVHRVHRFRH